MSNRLQGRVALVTGSTRGIGRAIAAAFAQQGATTLVSSRKAEAVATTVAELREETGGKVYGRAMHIGDPAQVSESIDAWTHEFGPIDVLVNNAAANPFFGPMLQIDWGAFDKTIDVNIRGTFGVTREVATRLVAAHQPGSIINVSSILGIQAAPLQGIYGVTKAAMLAMTKTLAVELGPAGVRVNAIAPGLVDTRFAEALTKNPTLRAVFEERTALGRIAQPEDIAGTAVFLASDESRYLTGQTIPVDGGYTIR